MRVDVHILNYIKEIERQQKEQDAIYHNAALRYGLSDTVMWLLYNISDSSEPCTQQKLCQQCFFPKQTINTAVSKLVRDGFVSLETLQGTRNQKMITLTQKGQELVSSTTDCLKKAESRAYGKLTAAELDTYLKLGSRLTECLREEIDQL